MTHLFQQPREHIKHVSEHSIGNRNTTTSMSINQSSSTHSILLSECFLSMTVPSLSDVGTNCIRVHEKLAASIHAEEFLSESSKSRVTSTTELGHSRGTVTKFLEKFEGITVSFSENT